MSLYRGFLTVGGLTAVSRVLGFIRDMLLAAVMGAGWVADAFFVSFKFPNLFRALFAEGAFNSAFVPLFTKRLRAEGKDSALLFAEQALAILLLGVIVTVIVAEIFMPYLVMAIAPGFSENPEKFRLAVLLHPHHLPLPRLHVVCRADGRHPERARKIRRAGRNPDRPQFRPDRRDIVCGGERVLRPAASGHHPGLGRGHRRVRPAFLRGLAARQLGMDPGFRWPRLTPDMRRLLLLAGPGLVTGGIYQVNQFIGTIIASLQASAVSFLYYADRINQLPLGMVGIAIGVVLLPTLSRHLADREAGCALTSQNRSLEFALLLTLPATVALVVIPKPIIQVLFQHGSFTAADTVQVSAALAASPAGCPLCHDEGVSARFFRARRHGDADVVRDGFRRREYRRLARLFFVIGHVGIAIATSLAGWTNAHSARPPP